MAPETTIHGDEASREHIESTRAALATSVVELALASIGSPYRWGGTGENGFDCSGLIQFAYAEHGVGLPRVSREQIRAGTPIEPRPSHLRPADILGFSRDHGGDISHVGLYVGDDEFIHSSTTGVQVSRLSNPYWQVRLVAVRRVLD
ncbi:MAG: C40 family peptidase [Gemmatimonadetes bacterium]|nr:C40 family peptidase [Gemmatimonadota bacterium]